MQLIGAEAAGEGIETGRHGAPLTVGGRGGVLHGAYSAIMQDEDGQILEAHSISAGLDYPGTGPEHAWLRDTGRATYHGVTDDAGAATAFRRLAELEGIIPALESAHAVAWVLGAGRETATAETVDLICLSGRGDKDLAEALDKLGSHRRSSPRGLVRWASSPGGLARRRFNRRAFGARGRAALMPYLMGGFPDVETSVRIAIAYADNGADLIELGVPFCDPLADGPVIHAAATARARGRRQRAPDPRGRRRGSPSTSRSCSCVTRTRSSPAGPSASPRARRARHQRADRARPAAGGVRAVPRRVRRARRRRSSRSSHRPLRTLVWTRLDGLRVDLSTRSR